jgi:RNA polymerase sigma-70 factor, ECF subfamily
MADSRQILEAFYQEQRGRLYACALAVTRCPDLAEDAVHEAFCRLLARPVQARNLKAYVFQAVRNAGVDQLRRQPRGQTLLKDTIFDLQPRADEAAIDGETIHRIATELDRLRDEERETIMQHLYAELTFREIAEIRGVPLGTITAWYRRGLEKLREILGEE